MYLNKLREMSDLELVALLANLKPTDDAVAHLAAAIAEGWSEGVRAEAVNECGDVTPAHVARLEAASELARRLAPGRKVTASASEVTRKGCYATTVWIDGEKFRTFFWLRRIPLSKVGPLFGRCGAWANVVIHKGHVGFAAADELACALGIHVDEFIAQVATEEELARAQAV